MLKVLRPLLFILLFGAGAVSGVAATIGFQFTAISSSSSYSIQANVDPPAAGIVQVPAQASQGALVKITATGANGFVFERWTINGVINTNNPLSVNITGNLALQGNFVPGISAKVEGDGHVLGSGVPSLAGAFSTLIAVPSPYSDFAGWFLNDALVESSSTNIFLSDGAPYVFEARFVPKPMFKVMLHAEPEYAGGFSFYAPNWDWSFYRDDEPLLWGQSIMWVAPWPGFRFRGWVSDGVFYTNENPSFIVTNNSQWTAFLEPTGLVASVSSDIKAKQTVEVPQGANVILVGDMTVGVMAWMKNRKLLASGSRSMVLTNVTRSDTGLYLIRNKTKPRSPGPKASSVIKLRVLPPKPEE